MKRAVLASMFAGLALLACGREGPELSDQAARDLAQRVQQVRAAAAAGDRNGAGAALAGLRGAVADHRSRGQLSEDRAARVLAAAADVESRLTLMPAPPPPTTRTTATAPPRRPPTTVTEGGDEDGDKDRGKGDGKEKDDD